MSTKRARPLTLDKLQRIVEQSNSSLMDRREFYVHLCLYVAHDGLLRSDELLSGLTAKDITWDDTDRSFTMYIARSKANRSGDGEYVRVCDHTGVSAYKLLSLWFQVYNLHEHPEWCVFPRVTVSRTRKVDKHKRPYTFDFRNTATYDWWVNVIRDKVSSIGLEPQFYSGHSLRAGGATDLFIRDVPYHIIKKMGRWKSDAGLVYFRDEIQVAQIVATAFGQVRKVSSNQGA